MDDPAFDTSEVDPTTQLIILHASNHDLPSLKPFLRTPGNASVQDPETGYTPLHAAIAACGQYSNERIKKASGGGEGEVAVGSAAAQQAEEEDDLVDIEQAKAVVHELFLSGAIWNDLDANDETPGCLAYCLGWTDLYDLCVQAGVRAEVLLGLMGSYEALESEDDDEEEEHDETKADENGEDTQMQDGDHTEQANGASEPTESQDKPKKDVNSEDYLASNLHITNNNLLDADNNGVMMTWETDIMRRTVDRFLAAVPPQPDQGPKVLNIGFGLGIIDTMFKELSPKPRTHHIIEAHPDVLSTVASPAHPFGPAWTASPPSPDAYQILPGKWQAVVPELIAQGQKYDIIYFDTFGEDYAQLKLFFQEYVPELLDEGGRFGFFNGLGADRRVCYDVYTKVVEIDLGEVGMDVEWEDVDVGAEVTGVKGGEGEWEGVRRRYWVLDKYRLPICKLDS